MSKRSPQPDQSLSQFSRGKRGHHALIGLLAVLAVLRLFAAFLQVPPFMAPALSLVLSAIFITVPILGLFYAANHPWTPRSALVGLIIGICLQFGFTQLLGQPAFNPLVSVLFSIVAQSGLLLWCFSLGALVASLVKDKNLLLPVAIFLAGFDVFLVTYPLGPVQQVLQKQPEVFQKVAYSVPKAIETGQSVGVQVGTYVGPADFIFLSTFFVTLFKFRMRTTATLPWMVAALVSYLLVVLLFGGMKLGPISLSALPALLPIGLVVLLVNLPEFKMKKDEWAGTAVVACLAIGLAWFGIYSASTAKPAPRAEPATSPVSPAPPESEATPAPAL